MINSLNPSQTGGVPLGTEIGTTFLYGKSVLTRGAKSVLNLHSGFEHKGLCGGPIVNAGDACAFACTYCYVEATPIGSSIGVTNALAQARKLTNDPSLGFQDVMIRRREAEALLRKALLKKDGSPRFDDPTDNRVVFFSTLVDPAPSLELLRETAELCKLILAHTSWQIRVLSKSSFLGRLPELIPSEYHHRLILGFSTGTLEEHLAKAIEPKTHPVRARLKALHDLQDAGLRTFGMLCPILPQRDYAKFAEEICEAIRVDRCEHVWAEVFNFGPKEVERQAMMRTLAAISSAGYHADAALFSHVFNGEGAERRWNGYAKATFLALRTHVPAEKFSFLQY